MTFEINVVKSGRAAVLQLFGELDLATAPQLNEHLAGLADEGVLEVTVDLSDLDFVDSSGLQALVVGHERLRQQGGDLGLRSPSPSTLKVLEITGLTTLFRLGAIDGVGPDAISGPGTRHVDSQMTGDRW